MKTSAILLLLLLSGCKPALTIEEVRHAETYCNQNKMEHVRFSLPWQKDIRLIRCQDSYGDQFDVPMLTH